MGLDDWKDHLSKKAQKTQNKIQDAAEDAAETAKDKAGTARDKAEEASRFVTMQARKAYEKNLDKKTRQAIEGQIERRVAQAIEKKEELSGEKMHQEVVEMVQKQQEYNDLLASKLEEALRRIEQLEERLDAEE
jgi:hypothetical protein